jgi:hypothetical protein
MGLYDLPAFIDHVLKINKFSYKLIYIGHSQGTAQKFAGLSQNFDDFKKRIKLFIAMGPISRVYFLNSRLLHIMDKLKVDIICKKLNFNEIFCSDEKLTNASSWLLPKSSLIANLVANLVSDTKSKVCNNQNRLSVYLSHILVVALLRLFHILYNYIGVKYFECGMVEKRRI